MRKLLNDWFERIKSLGKYRNTLISSVVVSFVLLFINYHMRHIMKLIHYPRGYSLPVRFTLYGLIFLLIPLITFPFIKDKENFGLKIGNWKKWLPDLLIAYAVMLILVIIFGRTHSFMRTYPLFKKAKESWQILAMYEGSHFIYMFGWEFLFRGYFLFSLRKETGDAAAVTIQMIPFAVLHAGKPELEAYGSIIAGLFLGIMALRGKSMIPCAILHFLVGFSMDIFAVLYSGSLKIF